MQRYSYFLLVFLFMHIYNLASAQKVGSISGTVKDRNTQQPLIGAVVILEGSGLGAVTDTLGRFRIRSIPPETYNLKADLLGYEPLTLSNIVVSTGNILTYNIELTEQAGNQEEVVITANNFGKRTETPLSVQNLTAEEIKSNPGGNFDISRVVQVLPGVGSTAGTGGYRNDIIIRGGGPNENIYYLDGIEVPQINHFATQGSAGGPVGILNVSFIQDVTVSSSSFGARYDNALSSVFQFSQRDGNAEKLQGNVRLSATELAATLDGPLWKGTTFLASARRSYLQFLFAAIDLSIRPNYWDFQYKTTTRLSKKTTLTTLGVGAIDNFKFGIPRNSSPEKEYVLRSVPGNDQWNYTIGASVRHLLKNGYLNIALSRNMMNNALDQFEDQDEDNESKRLLKVRSQEIENKLRMDVNKYKGKWRYSYGLMAQYVKFNNDLYNKILSEVRDSAGNIISPELAIKYNTAITFFKYGAFADVTRRLLKDRLSITAGLRTDMNTFTDKGTDPLQGISPRISASYVLSPKWTLNATSGMYKKLPIYTVLGYKNAGGEYVNSNNTYITAMHYVAGVEYIPTSKRRITVEGFYKKYSDYPVSASTGISLANQGGNYGAIGNENVLSIGKGRAYGLEVFFQQKLQKRIFLTLSYTFVRSEYSGKATDIYLPSAWDNRHLFSGLLGYKFNKGWELGLKYRYAGGAPYTPFDLAASRANYLLTGNGTPDYSAYNTLRLNAFNQMDLRLDKKYNFAKWTLDLYLDIQNIFYSPNPAYPQFTFQRNEDNTGWATTDGGAVKADGSNTIPVILSNNDPLILPTFGFIIEF